MTPGSAEIMIAPVSVCHQVSTIGVRAAADDLAVPDPRLGVDRLAHRPEQAQARQVEALRDLPAELHEGADGGGRRVEDRDPYFSMISHQRPGCGVVGRALVEHLGGAVGERAVDDVAVAGDPADVGGAPVDVGLGVQVEDVLVGERDLREVAAGGVQDALRLAGRAAGVEDEQRVLGRERLGARARRRRPRSRRATTGRGRRSTRRRSRRA